MSLCRYVPILGSSALLGPAQGGRRVHAGARGEWVHDRAQRPSWDEGARNSVGVWAGPELVHQADARFQQSAELTVRRVTTLRRIHACSIASRLSITGPHSADASHYASPSESGTVHNTCTQLQFHPRFGGDPGPLTGDDPGPLVGDEPDESECCGVQFGLYDGGMGPASSSWSTWALSSRACRCFWRARRSTCAVPSRMGESGSAGGCGHCGGQGVGVSGEGLSAPGESGEKPRLRGERP